MEASKPVDPLKSEQAKPAEQSTAKTAVKLVGETVVPGASLLIDGQFLLGGAHLVAGVLARSFLGPVGALLVMANSYSSSSTGKNLLQQITGSKSPKTQ